MNVLTIIQARLGSTRLPGKVMRPINDVPMIELQLRRVAMAKRVSKVIVATSVGPQEHPLVNHVERLGYEVCKGSEHDVLDRFYQAVKHKEPDAIVRLTADCPLIDPNVIDEVVALHASAGADYTSNISPRTYPDGLDVEVFSFQALQDAVRHATKPAEREHVTPFIRESVRFKSASLVYDRDCSQERWTVDELADFDVINAVFKHFHPRVDFGWLEVMSLRGSHAHIFEANHHLNRSERAR